MDGNSLEKKSIVLKDFVNHLVCSLKFNHHQSSYKGKYDALIFSYLNYGYVLLNVLIEHLYQNANKNLIGGFFFLQLYLISLSFCLFVCFFATVVVCVFGVVVFLLAAVAVVLSKLDFVSVTNVYTSING